MVARIIGNVEPDVHGEKTMSLIASFLLDWMVFRYRIPLNVYKSIDPDSQPIAKYSRPWFSLIDVIGDLVLIRNSLYFSASKGLRFIRHTWTLKDEMRNLGDIDQC